MSYTLNLIRKPGYLHATVAGKNTKANVLAYLSDVYKSCIGTDPKCLLIEEDLSGPSLGIVEMYEIISLASRGVTPLLRRIAYVDTNSQHQHERLQFAETAAVNRGVNVRVFKDVSEAEAWLLHTSEESRTTPSEGQ
jgi:hypothetical protein